MLYQIIPSLQEFIGDMPLLGHNLEFDLKFLCRAGLDVTPETAASTIPTNWPGIC